MASPRDQLSQLAELNGIQTEYYEINGQLKHASPEALARVLQAMGAPLAKIEGAPGALRSRFQALWNQVIEPVNLAWDGAATEVLLRLPASAEGMSLGCSLHFESGETRDWSVKVKDLPATEIRDVEGVAYSSRRLPITGGLPLGYHKLAVGWAGKQAESLIVAAPMRAYEPSGGSPSRTWGVFLPLYALHSERSWGAGDFSDLEALSDWVTQMGGGLVATLPLLAAFLDEPFEPGPYSPASRLFWNEFYLDVTRCPEFSRCPGVEAIISSKPFQQHVAELRSAELVDYQRQMKLKRRVLSELARVFFAGTSKRLSAFRGFLATNPHWEDYARFRAVGERRRAPWPTWPTPLREGAIQEGEYDEEVKQYHLYVQWLAQEQLQSLAAKTRAKGPGFYLDLPLGVNPDSYDVWRYRSAFATGIAAGAPPDPFFAKGQNWGFPPLHPQRIREQGYAYIRAYLHHHLQLAGVLRIDHMMGFHRLFWIPREMGAANGVYVRYPSEELYALFSLESHRHQSMLVGEDLGTVPPEVRPDMERHNIRRMYVLQFEVDPQKPDALKSIPPGCVASLNTHDIPPFGGFWECKDIQDRVDLGILTESAAAEERKQRWALVDAIIRSLRLHGRLQGEAFPLKVLLGCFGHLSSGQAQLVLANLEDLWWETRPQNVPGTWRERPNWLRKARHTLEAIRELPEVVQLVRELEKGVKKEK